MKTQVLTLCFIVAAAGFSASCATGVVSLCVKDVDLAKPKPGDIALEEAAANAAYAQRDDVAQLRVAIKHWREAVAINPRKTDNYVKLAKALYLLGDGYLRVDDETDQMVVALKEAAYFAELALGIQNADYRGAVCAGTDPEEAVDKLTKADVPAVYWYATALGKWGLATSIMTALGNKDTIFAMMVRLKELDPSYWYGAVDRYLGAYHSKIPITGGNKELSLVHFKMSLEIENNYLATHVLMADMLAHKFGDEVGKKMYLEHVQFVLDADVNVIPALKPEHILEKKKAELLLEEVEDRF